MPEEYFAINHSMSRRTPSTMDSAGILAEVVALNGAKGTITLGTGTWRIDLATVTPTNVRLVPEQGAMLTKYGSGTLTINGPFEAPLAQVFSGFAAGDVLFVGDATKEVFPAWWGAKGDYNPGTGSGTDSTGAIQTAIDAVRVQATTFSRFVTLAPGNYKYTHLDIGTAGHDSSGVVLRGTNWFHTTMTHVPSSPDADGISFYYSGGSYAWGNGIRDINLCTANANTRRLLSVVHQHHFVCSGVGFNGSNGATCGLYVDYLVASLFRNCEFQNFSVADPSGSVGSAAIVGAASATTSTVFRDCYFTSNLRGFRPAGGAFFFNNCWFDYHSDVMLLLNEWTDEASSVVVDRCHFEGGANGSIRFGDNASAASGNGSVVTSSSSAYLYSVTPPAAHVDIGPSGRFYSKQDSFSGSCFVRVHRGGAYNYRSFAKIDDPITVAYYPDAIKIVQNDSDTIAGSSWKQQGGIFGRIAGNADVAKESSYVWQAGFTNPHAPAMLMNRAARILLGQNISVTAPVESDGSTPVTNIPHGRRFRFTFVQDVTGTRTVAFDSSYVLAQIIPSGSSATGGQYLEVEFRFDSDSGKWLQCSAFVGWSSAAEYANLFVSGASSGNDAFRATTGARWHIGGGASDYISSDGSAITSESPVNAPSLTSSVTSGDGIKLATGGHLHIGDGTLDYLISDGTRIHCPGEWYQEGIVWLAAGKGIGEPSGGNNVVSVFSDGVEIGHTGLKIGFLGASRITRPSVSGSKSGNAALASLITALANLGLISDSTT